ncbi:unnamed protein product, partial [Prorocentrum cordatum]
EDMDVKEMMRVMMKDMKEMKLMLTRSERIAQEAIDEATSAKQSALKATLDISGLEDKFEKFQQSAVTKEDVTRMIEETMSQSLAARNMYCKSEFEGVFFVKFMSDASRQMFLDTVNSFARGQPGGFVNTVWAKPDLPFDIRMQHGVLFGLRRLLATWGFNKTCVKVNTDDSSLSVAGTVVTKTGVKDYQLELKWVDQEWGKWDALQSSSELSEITAGAKGKLDRAK